jgi:ATP/maltotriose-dependent transcriptional regulator MalT
VGSPGAIETLEGDLSAALTAREQADAIQVRFDQQTIRSTSQALLAELHRQRGDLDAARAAIGLSDALSAPEDVITYAVGHGVRARLALTEGHWDDAERWADSAVRYASVTHFPETQAEARLTLARVLSARGYGDEARSATGPRAAPAQRRPPTPARCSPLCDRTRRLPR